MQMPAKQMAAFIDLLIDTATTQTRKQSEFTIPGLGKLVKVQCAARTGRQPAAGEAIKIEAKTPVRFRLAKSAKDAVVPPNAYWFFDHQSFIIVSSRLVTRLCFVWL